MDNLTEKHCPRCDAAKAPGEFGKNRSRPDGLRVYCKACYLEYNRTYGQAASRKGSAWYKRKVAASATRRREAYRDLPEYRESVKESNAERRRNLSEQQRIQRRAAGRRRREENPEKHREYSRQWRSDNKDRYQRNNRRITLAKYGLTEESFDSILAAQNGLCAICLGPEPIDANWNIDHCHNSGVVRGLLCGHCNRGLGMFRDDLDILDRAMDYLSRFESGG